MAGGPVVRQLYGSRCAGPGGWPLRLHRVALRAVRWFDKLSCSWNSIGLALLAGRVHCGFGAVLGRVGALLGFLTGNGFQ